MSSFEFTHEFNQHKNGLQSFAFSLTQNEEDAKDLLQETAFKAFKYRSMYRPHTNLRAWLMTIMRNTFINSYRKKKRRQLISDTTGSDFLLDSGQRIVRNSGESNTMVEEITQVVDSLEDWLKVPFLMHFKGYKYEEISQSLGIPLGTVKSRIFFARKKLQEMVSRMYGSVALEELLD